MRGKAKVKAGWTEFTIRISCAIESLLPDGEYDQEANKSCVDCFGQLAIVPPWEGSDIVRSCSSTHLPNIKEHCNSELEQETIFRKLWMESKKCFNDYVKKNDVNFKVFKDIKEGMKHFVAKKKFDWSSFIIGTSCALETLLPDGDYDEEAIESCRECFDEIKDAVPLGDGQEVIHNCSSIFFPNIFDHCIAELNAVEEPACYYSCNEDQKKKISFGEFWTTAQRCFYEYVKETDEDGHIQGDIKEWMMEEDEEEFDWSNFIVGSSCAIEALLPEGQYDMKLNESCVECFGKLDSGNGTADDITIIKNCSN